MNRIRASFRTIGGVHPEYGKDATAELSLEVMPAPKTLLVSLGQHLGPPSRPVVKKGDAVARGQPIAEPTGYVSSWVHAPASGTVKSLEEMITASGRAATVVEIETDGRDQTASPLRPGPDWRDIPASELVKTVSAAGIIGMGGAGFPTHVKLSPPAGKSIDTLIINGAECEPFLTADARLMIEQADRIWSGALIIRKILGARYLKVAIEDNKPEAILAMERAMKEAQDDVDLVVLDTRYPQGAEKQLIYSITGREVPSGGLPMDVNSLVENVGTAAAIHDAVVLGLPLTERAVTVTGPILKSPKNVIARIGTRFEDLLAFCGGATEEVAKVICGGPMMGISQSSLDAAVNKTTSGLLFIPRTGVECFTSMPCVSCGRCVEACSMRLIPSSLSLFIEAEDYDMAEQFDVLDCIECGCCAFVCPAYRPLVQHMKRGKAEVTARRRKRESKKGK